MDKMVVLFTMKGCAFCEQFKKMLKEEKIDFVNRDIQENKDEYEMFVKSTGNEFVPAFMLIENPESEKPTVGLYAPDRDFEDIEQGVSIIREFYER